MPTKRNVPPSILTGQGQRSFAREEKKDLRLRPPRARHATHFSRGSRRHRAARFFLAHHADDLVETFLSFDPQAQVSPVSPEMRNCFHPDAKLNGVDLTTCARCFSVWRSELTSMFMTSSEIFAKMPEQKLSRGRAIGFAALIIPHLEKNPWPNIPQNIGGQR